MAQNYKGFSPILDRVLLRRVEDAPKEGVQLPSKYRQQTNKGEILAIGQHYVLGSKVLALRTAVEVGDHVLFGEYSAERFILDGEELYLVRLAQIRGKQARPKTGIVARVKEFFNVQG